MPRGQRRAPRKSIYDPVHGPIALDGAPLELVGHAAFQRLWGIRQTGLAHLVFPGANHTRLEHSLGVHWVAGRMALTLGLSELDRDTVAAGALLHDLGHGPFSHTLDGPMLEALGVGHERLSRKWIVGGGPDPVSDGPETGPSIPEILERHGFSPKRVADLVDPPPAVTRDRLLRSLLHGPVDADRIDYLERDAHYTGVAHGAIDAARLLDTLEVDRDRLVFAEKGRSAVEGFLVGRALMYTSVYFHKTVRSAEVMLASAVERSPGYPESARRLFGLTDGDLLVELEREGGYPAQMARALRRRMLFKRAGGLRSVSAARRRSIRRLVDRPAERRGIEEELAQLFGAPPGAVLLDLAGLDVRDPDAHDLDRILLREGDRVVRPFARSPPWQAVLLRPPSRWAVAVYVERGYRHAAEERLARALARFL